MVEYLMTHHFIQSKMTDSESRYQEINARKSESFNRLCVHEGKHGKGAVANDLNVEVMNA